MNYSSVNLMSLLKGESAGHHFRGNQWHKIGSVATAPKEHKARIAALRIPPAWTDVVLNKDEKAALQATGLDSKGRKQYKYSAEHTGNASAEKFQRLKDFHAVAGGVKKQAFSDMNNKKLTRQQRDSAAVVALIAETGFRMGSNADTGAEKKAYGASNLKTGHVVVSGDRLRFNFTGKKGVSQTHSVVNKQLAKYISERKAQLIAERSRGALFDVSPASVRNYFHGIAGGDFNVKDYRTWHGTNEALREVKSMQKPRNATEYKKARKAVGERVAKKLGNTATVALNSYINPTVFSSWGFGNE